MKKVLNIVIYKSIEDGIEAKRACIFYDDGSVSDVSYEEGIAAIKEIAANKNITSRDELKKLVNKDSIYVMTEEELSKNYDSFLPKKETKSPNELFNETFKMLKNLGKEEKKSPKKMTDILIPVTEPYDENYVPEDDEEENTIIVHEEEVSDSEYIDFTEENNEKIEETTEKIYDLDEDYENGRKAIKVAVGAIVVAVGVTAAVIATGFVLTRCSKKITNETTDSNSTDGTNITDINDDQSNNNNDNNTNGVNPIIYDNDLYNDYTFTQLLDVTINDFQKSEMINISSSLNGFNKVFADNYVESGHDIKAALSFDEVVALQQAYNNYSSDEIRAYFNGYEVDAVYMSNAYKSATLQLMGAYTIETSKNPVDMSILIDSQEGKEFYNRYHAMFLAAKEATGDEQIRLVKEFYAAIEKDFPITEEDRTEGISHADKHNSIKDYQLSVVPMIASAEMIFQNIGIDYSKGIYPDSDYTLNDVLKDFINDIGLCNHVDDKFERIETITLVSDEDNTNPLYIQYKNTIISDLVNRNEYVIDDAHRELSNLRRFQEVVNNDPLWKHRTTYTGYYGKAYTENYGKVTTKTWAETTTTTSSTSEPIPGEVSDEDKAKVDEKIKDENEQNRKKAEEEAEREAKRQQEEENKNKEAIEEEVKKDNENLEKDVEDINNKINNGEKPNENDYQNINFDDNHSNKDGELDSSVKNVTTDGSGANKDLPDPNKNSKTYVEYAGAKDAYIEYGEGYESFDGDGKPVYQYTR